MNKPNPDICFHESFCFRNGKIAKNRLTLAPMTNRQSHSDGSLGQDELDWLVRCARGGFGLLLTCASYISPTAKAWQGQLGVHDDALIDSLSVLPRAVQSHGALCLMQIFHGGVRSPSWLTGHQPVSASEFELSIPNFEKPRALTIQEIENIVQDYAAAAYRAYRAGFDGVEIHGANGYLITQFISTTTNQRRDEYGGSLENRARFVRQITRACRQSVPPNFLVGIRLSPESNGMLTGLDLDDTLQIMDWLISDGIDFVDLSMANGMASTAKYPDQKETVVEYLKRLTQGNIPVFAGGSVRLPRDAEAIIKQGADFVYLGAAAIGNVMWPRLSQDRNYKPFFPPYSLDHLRSTQVSESFISYLLSLPRPLVVEVNAQTSTG